MTPLAWPLVALVLGLALIAAALWVFHAWRHPRQAEQRLAACESRLAVTERLIADLKLARELE
jgi:hypothetical protein